MSAPQFKRRVECETNKLADTYTTVCLKWASPPMMAQVNVLMPVRGGRNVPALLKVGERYPFQPPELRLNGRSYHTLAALPLLRDFARTEGRGCPCCNSILCQPWSPSFTMSEVLAEAEAHLHTLFVRVMERTMSRVVVACRLFPYCPLDAYL